MCSVICYLHKKVFTAGDAAVDITTVCLVAAVYIYIIKQLCNGVHVVISCSVTLKTVVFDFR